MNHLPRLYTAMCLLSLRWTSRSVASLYGMRVVLNWRSCCREQSGTTPEIIGLMSCFSSERLKFRNAVMTFAARAACELVNGLLKCRNSCCSPWWESGRANTRTPPTSRSRNSTRSTTWRSSSVAGGGRHLFETLGPMPKFDCSSPRQAVASPFSNTLFSLKKLIKKKF